MTGQITGVTDKTDAYGARYTEYTGTIGSFTAFDYYNWTDSYLTGDDGATTDVRVSPESGFSSTFTLRVYEDSHKQVVIRLFGSMAGTQTSITYSNTKTRQIDRHGEDVFDFYLGEGGHYIGS